LKLTNLTQPGGGVQRERERERKEMGMAVMGGCNSICERPGWVENISEWP